MRVIKLFIPIILISILPFIAHCDKILRNNGQTLEGKIVSEDQVYVTIDIGGSEFQIAKEEIKQIIREQTTETDLDKARTALASSNYNDCIKYCLAALSLNQNTEEIKTLFTKAYSSLKTNSKTAISSGLNLDNEIKNVTNLLKLNENASIASLHGGPDKVNAENTELKNLLGEAHFNKAKKLAELNNSANDAAIVNGLKTALQFTQEGTQINYTTLLSLGLYYEKINLLNESYVTLERAYNTAPSISDRVNTKKYLDNVKTKLVAQTRTDSAVPTPRSIKPDPTPVIVIQYTPSPTPPPTPTPTLEQKVKEAGKTKNLLPALKAFPGKVVAFLKKDGVIEWILIIAGILVFNWIIPWQIIKRRCDKGDSAAVKYATWVKWLGLIPLFIYLIANFSNRGSRKRCPYCNKLIDSIDSYSDMNFFICPHCNENISPIYDLKDYIEHLIKSVQMELSKDKKKATDSVIEKDAMVKLVRAIITMAYRRRASDIHIEPELECVKIRVRVDGILYDLLVLPRQLSSAVISAIKVMASLDIAEKRIPQDGRIQVWIDKSDVDIRLNTSPIPLGEKASMRLLDSKAIDVDSTKLGLEAHYLATYERSIRKPHGVFLVTGPTGSGKSTTLYVAIKSINNGEKNIVTIENPIEYKVKGINQMQVNEAQNFTFATGLRSILRQDPDIIMVGEIRDKETAEICIDASMTGHLVFSTLHTIDTITSFSRLNDLGVPSRRFAPALELVMAQRLVRVNCSECKKPYKPKKQDLETLNLFNIDKDTIFIKGTGCEVCDQIGYLGRIGIFEMLTFDDELKELIESGAPTSSIRELAGNKGMKTIKEEGIIKVLKGLTTVEEVIRVTS